MNLRRFFTKLNNTIRPLHVQGQEFDSGSALDAKVVAFGAGNPGNVHTGHAPAPAPTNWVPPQQDENARH